MGFKYKKGKLICTGKAGMMGGYLPEPKDKEKLKKKKLI